jgi:hypothetical protein
MPNDKIKHGRSKFISNYGGVGSIIDTTDCSILIETFDNWQYAELQNRLKDYIIIDDRLRSRLQTRFPRLQHLVKIPTENSLQNDQVRPTANYFPKWFYCTRCNRFADYNEWKKRWTSASKKLDYFNPPKCSNHECKEQVLEQTRFVMTCSNGHIHDIPWRHWNLRLPSDTTNSNTDEDSDEIVQEGPKLDLSRTCCDNQDLRYEISKENTELSGLWITCKSCGKGATLKGLFGYVRGCEGKKFWLGLTNGQFVNEACYQKSQVKVKSSNSVYYSNTLSSIWIPEKQILDLSAEMRTEIDSIRSDEDFEDKDLEKFARRNSISIDLINQYLQEPESTNVPESIFRQVEYDYFLNKEQPESNEVKFRLIDCKVGLNGFERLVKVDKLKKISVQTSFTRQEPIDVDAILSQDGNSYQYNVQRQSVSKNNFETKLLPSIESYGEGILFILDRQKLQNWETNVDVLSRVETLKTNAKNSDWQSHKIEADKLTPRKVLIHTLSHLIIRELEYVCGYPASSLQERLYVSNNMHGFLISAYDGTDGYLGGLANLCNDLSKLQEYITSALQRATDCSLDPICFDSEGQGIAQLNLAACHSCVLLPEISCELSNLFLDRQLIVNSSVAYFANMQ